MTEGVSLYPQSSTLSQAQAEANPYSNITPNPIGDMSNLEGFNNPNTGLAPAQGAAASAGDATKSLASTISNIFQVTTLERMLIVGIGLILLTVGLVMLGKGPTNISIVNQIADAAA